MASRFYRIGAGATDSPGEIVTLLANVLASGNYMTFLTGSPGSSYLVPASQTLRITRIRAYTNTASQGMAIGYGDTAVAQGASSPTNFVRISDYLGVTAAYTPYFYDGFWAVPTGKYPCLLSEQGLSYVEISGFVYAA
jgi:hypothetical protein